MWEIPEVLMASALYFLTYVMVKDAKVYHCRNHDKAALLMYYLLVVLITFVILDVYTNGNINIWWVAAMCILRIAFELLIWFVFLGVIRDFCPPTYFRERKYKDGTLWHAAHGTDSAMVFVFSMLLVQ